MNATLRYCALIAAFAIAVAIPLAGIVLIHSGFIADALPATEGIMAGDTHVPANAGSPYSGTCATASPGTPGTQATAISSGLHTATRSDTVIYGD